MRNYIEEDSEARFFLAYLEVPGEVPQGEQLLLYSLLLVAITTTSLGAITTTA